jgi:hypothetical protein
LHENKKVKLFSIIILLLLLYITWKQKNHNFKKQEMKTRNLSLSPTYFHHNFQETRKKNQQIINSFQHKFDSPNFFNYPSPSTQIPSTQESFALWNWSCTLFPKLFLPHSFT